MKKEKIVSYLLIVIFTITHHSCVEPYQPKTSVFEDAIVIEATITNEYKHQLITLSRTRKLEEDDINYENNATVQIVDSNNNTYDFNESSSGKYHSSIEFSAQPDINYQLFITTTNGNSYSSEASQLPAVTQIDDLYAIRKTNNQGDDGIFIYIDSYDPSGNSTYYRHTYEETYKIIAPFWSPYDGKVVVVPGEAIVDYSLVLKEEEQRVCYKTINSTNINLTNINEFSDHAITELPVRFIKQSDYITLHRYSILVRQYIQNEGANSYYKILNELSSSDNIFSQTQTGYNRGNITSTSNPNEKIIGYFDVSSVSEQRIYFNYEDFFPNEELPPYPSECLKKTPLLRDPYSPDDPEISPLLVSLGTNKYYQNNPLATPTGDLPWIMVPKVCGDCRSLGSNIVPAFWVE